MQVLLAGCVPAAYGALCGWLLGVNKAAYLIAVVPIAIAGGFVAGLEHERPSEAAIRGFIGGSLFGGGILVLHEATGKAAKVKLPHPAIGLLVVTALGGLVLGALGAAFRRSRQRAKTREGAALDLSRLKWSEYLGFAGAAVLVGSLFLKWWSTSCDHLNPTSPAGCNANSKINGHVGSFNAFDTYKSLQWWLIAACIAPFVLSYILARGHELTWRPGEVTMIVGMTAGALILLNGIILGKPSGGVDISFEPGYFIGLIGANMILAGGVIRQARYSGVRKPPGVF
jgi:hypothetical protein